MQFVIPAIGFGLVTASILALAAVGFTMQFGVTNILNLAFAEQMAVAGFLAYLFNTWGVNIWVCMAIAGAITAVLSVLLNRFVYMPFIRRGTKLFGMVIVTIAVGLMIQNMILAAVGPNFFEYTLPTRVTIHIAALTFTTLQLIIMAVAIMAMASVHSLLRYTKLGTAMRATATDASLARSCGIRTDLVIDLAWAISGGLSGLAGVTLFINTVSFKPSTASPFLVVIIAAAILGGVGQPYGAMLGALTIGLSTEVAASFINPAYKNVIAFVLLVVVLLLRPQGILAEIAVQREVAA